MSDDAMIKKFVDAEMVEYYDGAYVDSSCARDQLTRFAHAIEQLARNTALEEAAKLVDDRYDECEPWICGDAIRALKENK